MPNVQISNPSIVKVTIQLGLQKLLKKYESVLYKEKIYSIYLIYLMVFLL